MLYEVITDVEREDELLVVEVDRREALDADATLELGVERRIVGPQVDDSGLEDPFDRRVGGGDPDADELGLALRERGDERVRLA